MAETTATRELLLRISGEVSPSAKKAVEEAIADQQAIVDTGRRTMEQADNALLEQLQRGKAFYTDLIEVLKRFQKEVMSVADAEQQTATSTGEAGDAAEGTTSQFKDFTTVLKDALKSAVGFAAKVVVLHLVFKTLANIAGKVKDALVGIFEKALKTVVDLGKRGVAALKSMAETALEVSSAFQQADLTLRAAAKTIEGGATLMKVLREESIALGKSWVDLIAIAPRLAPYAEGDIENFREMVNLAFRLQAARPDISMATAVRYLTQFRAGAIGMWPRAFSITTDAITSVTDELGFTNEALDIILNKMGLTTDLVQDQAGAWKGLIESLKTTKDVIIKEVSGPAFGFLNEQLAKLVGWVRANDDEITKLARTLGQDLGSAVRNVATQIFGPMGLSEDALFKALEWGANLVGSLTEGVLRGINQFLIPAIVQITQVFANFLMGASPPVMGILATIDQWFGPVLRAYLSGFDASDFQVLNDIGRIIKASLDTAVATGEITQEDANRRLLETRQLTVDLVQEFKTLGTVSDSVWSGLSSILGMDIQLIQEYLGLVQSLESAQNALAAAEDAYAEAQEHVRDVQEEIRRFELETAEIPERYKRGRRMELEYQLMVAEEQARIQQEAVEAAQEQVRQAQEMLNAYNQMIQALEKFAKDAVDAIKALKDEEAIDIGAPITGPGDELAELMGRFAELLEKIRSAFAGVSDEVQFLVNFMKGLLGIGEEFERVGPHKVALPGYAEGVALKDALIDIRDNLTKIGDALERVEEFFTNISIMAIITYGTLKATWDVLQEIIKAAIPPWLSSLWDVLSGTTGIGPLAIETGATALAQIFIDPVDISAWIGVFQDILRGQDKETTAAVEEGITGPILEAAEELQKETVGESIFPDMIAAILKLFTDLPSDLRAPLTSLVDTIRIYGESAAEWFGYFIDLMRNDIRALINDLNSVISTLGSYMSALSQAQISSTIHTGVQQFQTGGIVNQLQVGLLHRNEVVLNPTQQANLIMNMAQATVPSAGFGAGALSAEINTNITVVGSLSEAEKREIERLAENATYSGIERVFREAGVTR